MCFYATNLGKAMKINFSYRIQRKGWGTNRLKHKMKVLRDGLQGKLLKILKLKTSMSSYLKYESCHLPVSLLFFHCLLESSILKVKQIRADKELGDF